MIQEVQTPWGPIGYITYKRTYARKFEDTKNSDTEEFSDSVERIIKACRTQLKCNFTEEEELRLAEHILSLRGTVAGRFLWQLGTKTVSKLGLPSLQNCAFVSVNDPIRPFTWAMDLLMLGAGVGFNIQKENVYQLPKLQRKKPKIIRMDDASADYIVPDTREGWVKLLGKVLKSYFYSGEGFTYSTQLVRGKGANIKGFGGVASGPEILVEGLGYICDVLDARRGKRLRPIDCLDIMCIIGMIVVAGNVRRSALIAIGDCDDIEYLRAKRWDLQTLPKWRSNSNNSVVCNDISQLPQEFWELYQGNGEPYGLINLDLARSCGRLGETQYPDLNVNGFNPCAEQPLEDFETCCLAETFLPNIKSIEELKDVVTLLYRVNKHSLALPCHLRETERVVHKNMRMGIGITGYLTATEEQRSWLPEVYKYLREYDKKYSEDNGFPVSIKLTTIKPSGTLSLLAGVSSGGHPEYAPYFIRRMRIASESPLIEVCKIHGYSMEYVRNSDGTEDYRTMVVEFPCKAPEHAIFSKNLKAIEQLEVVKRLQKEWSDNAVSVTIYYRLEELEEIKEWLSENYNNSLKSVSFLLHAGHGFDQAPLEEISEEVYVEMISKCTPITDANIREEDISSDQIGCESGVCPIK